MNRKERELVALLEMLRDTYDAVSVKAEFEAEGTRFEELLRLKEIVERARMNLVLKIGGPEDVWGILQARRVGVSHIVAPMIESDYALKKYLEAADKHIPDDERDSLILGINIETAAAVSNLTRILDTGKKMGLQSVTVGRVDLVGSYGFGRDSINSERMFEVTKKICHEARRAGIHTAIGGGIERGSHSFLQDLISQKLLDHFETRKIVFSARQNPSLYENAVRHAHRFELGWLINKQQMHQMAGNEDAERIQMLEKRIQS